MDRNYLIDLAHSIMQDAADEWHIKEELSGLETEKAAIDREEMPDLYEKLEQDIERAKQDYIDSAVLRRAKTDYLGAKSPAYNFHKRCQLKHRATSFVQMSETYLADPNDTTYRLMVWSEERFWKALMGLMGVDNIPNCGRCLSDELNRISE